MTRTTFVVALLALVLGSGWLMAAGKPIVGSWDCVATPPDGNETHFTIKVKEDGGKLIATATFAEGGEIQLTDPKFEKGTFSFKATIESGTYEVQLKLAGDKLDGTFKGADASGSIKGARKA